MLVHPQSIVHGLVEFRDGAFIAELGSPDMRVPIAHCLAWPDRVDTPAHRLDLAKVATLAFEESGSCPLSSVCGWRAVHSEAGARLQPSSMRPMKLPSRRFWIGGSDLRESPTSSRKRCMRRKVAAAMGEPASVEDALSVDHVSRSLARALLPEIAAKAS